MSDEKERRNRRYEEKIDGFCKFVNFAISHSQDIKNVGPVVLKLGQGDGVKGWKLIQQCEDKLKNGISPRQVFEDLSQADKYLLTIKDD
jgi:hypothetical protein